MATFGKRKKPLTKKQLAQRKYASRMRGVRKRATTTRGGRGRVRARKSATTMRAKLGLK